MIKFQDLLNKETNKIFSNFSSVNLKDLDELKKSYYTIDENSQFKEDKKQRLEMNFYPLIKYIIKDTNLDVEYEIENKKYNKTHISSLVDKRVEQIFDLINGSIEYAISHKLHVPDTTLHVWISDRIPWYNDIDKKFPIFLFAKPMNTNFLIFPDNTFICLTADQKYGGKCVDWNETKNTINNNCSNLDFNNKTNEVYFKGTATTVRNSRIRENLEIYSRQSNWLKIKLDAWNNFTNIEQFCNYKFLLNLPGRYPWSNRFKYLFLMKSIIINIDVYTVSLEKEFNDLPWTTFINYIVRPNKDYINIKMTYYYSKEYGKTKKMNLKETKKIIKQLKKIYDRVNNDDNYKDKLLSIINSGYRRVNNLENKHVYKYIYNCILQNSKINFI